MHLTRLLPALAACALALSGCNKSDQAFDARVHDYIVSHPEVIQEAMTRLQARQDAAAAVQAKTAIATNRQALERDPRDFVANPNGRITVTEFYDYRCPHCITAAPTVLKIIHDQPDVRFVFKEFPIFGAVSEKASAGRRRRDRPEAAGRRRTFALSRLHGRAAPGRRLDRSDSARARRRSVNA
jgi:protein-disulfide isomerase